MSAAGLALDGDGMGVGAVMAGLGRVARVCIAKRRGWLRFRRVFVAGFAARDRVEGRGERPVRRRGIELELLETM
jgi:hypothetical protein